MTRGGGDIISDERAAQIVDGKKPTATLLSIRLVSPVISSIVVRRSHISGRIGPRSRENTFEPIIQKTYSSTVSRSNSL